MLQSLIFKLRTHPSPLWVIFEMNFFRHLAAAVLTAILPLYFRQFVSSDAQLGIIFFIGYLSAFCSSLYSSRIIEHLKKRRTLLLALIGFTIAFALFSVANHSAILLMLYAVYQFFLSLFIIDVSLYIKHFSNFRTLAENTGKSGSLGNLGWIIGPLLGSLIAAKFSFEAVFLFSSAVSLVALIIFFFVRLETEAVVFLHKQSLRENFRLFFADANLRRTYLNNAGLGFIYSIWDYLPVLMFGLGATIPTIGLTKTLMGIPQAIFEFPIGRVADRETGERRIFIVGYIIAGAMTSAIAFAYDLKFLIAFFFIAATGTSLLEMTRDPYYFRQVGEGQVEMTSVYRTSDNIPYITGQLLAILCLSFFPLRVWFFIGGALATIIFPLNAWRLKEFKKKTTIFS